MNQRHVVDVTSRRIALFLAILLSGCGGETSDVALAPAATDAQPGASIDTEPTTGEGLGVELPPDLDELCEGETSPLPDLVNQTFPEIAGEALTYETFGQACDIFGFSSGGAVLFLRPTANDVGDPIDVVVERELPASLGPPVEIGVGDESHFVDSEAEQLGTAVVGSQGTIWVVVTSFPTAEEREQVAKRFAQMLIDNAQ